MSADAEALHGGALDGPGEGTPSLPRRLLDTVFSPGKMARDVSRDPRWAGALLVSVALVALSTYAIPPELYAEVQRRMMIERGVANPPTIDPSLIRTFGVLGATVGVTVLSFLFAGIYTFIFAFVLGDEGRFKQYLAIGAHAGVVPAMMAVLLTPLRVAAENPQLTLSVGTFFVFLPQGFLLAFLRFLDLSQIWAALVTAAGAHAIDRRRSFGSAAVILVGMTAVVALVLARFVPTPP